MKLKTSQPQAKKYFAQVSHICLGVPVIFIHMWLSWCFEGGHIKEWTHYVSC